jgi:hypothetical protein
VFDAVVLTSRVRILRSSRALFADAELEQAEAGDASALHVRIFDELDPTHHHPWLLPSC